MRPRLRGRLLAAFLWVALPPLLLLTFAVSRTITRSFEESAAGRLNDGLQRAQERVQEMKRTAETKVGIAVREDLSSPAPSPDAVRTLASRVAARYELPALEILDEQTKIVSSHHFPAGFGLSHADEISPSDPWLRLEKVGDASGYGISERLALMASHAGTWQGTAVIVRGGFLLDAEFLRSLSAWIGSDVAIRDTTAERWITLPQSHLRHWQGPPLRFRSGNVTLDGGSYDWAAAPINSVAQPAAWLVVATSRRALDEVIADVRQQAIFVAGAVLLAALASAFFWSDRIASPVRELARGAQRVAAGDLDASVAVSSKDEIGELASSFNAMTTDLRTSRDRLLQAERVAAWREMARRLAHELKNPIFPIQLSMETLRKALDQESPRETARGAFAELFREASDTILEELRSLRHIIEEFSQFARMPPPQLRPTNLNGIVEQTLALYSSGTGTTRIETALSETLPTVPADRGLLSRALGNLVANALEAMPQGGTLRVRTASDAGTVRVSVGDTGPGLTEEQRTRLFTPYFTTKKGGTGLGLAIVQGIVSDHGGRIDVESEPGRGTTFTLVLPRGH